MNVNKRIGKFKQWTGEKLGGQAKTELSEDLQDLQDDIVLRRTGVDKIYTSSKDLNRHLSKRLEHEDVDGGKGLVFEVVGTVMAGHGDEFGGDSAFGQALRSYGRAHQQVATHLSTYIDRFQSEWLASLERDLAGMDEYEAQRKKLGSRRLTYDATLAKVQKSKKEKSNLEADLRIARSRYEETSKDVQERGLAIQEAEADQLAAVTGLLEAEYAYVEKYFAILQELKAEWPDQASVLKSSPARRKPPTAPIDGTGKKASPLKPRSGFSTPLKSTSPLPPATDSDDSDADADYAGRLSSARAIGKPNRSRSSTVTKATPAPTSRKNTITASASAGAAAVAAAAAAAVSSSGDKDDRPSTGGGGRFGGIRIPGMPSSSKDYATVKDDDSLHLSDTDAASPVVRRRSLARSGDVAPPLRRSLTAPAFKKPHQRVVAAKWDYSPSEPDELFLLRGDHIVVVEEINADWYVGQSERSGQKGMFPAAYCEDVSTKAFALPDKDGLPPTPPDEEVPKFIERQYTGDSNVSDAFADPTDSNASSTDDFGSYAHVAAPLVTVSRSTGASGGKRPPPPPPTRRAHSSTGATGTVAAAGGAKSVPMALRTGEGDESEDEETEAFGNVSALKQRLGMFK